MEVPLSAPRAHRPGASWRSRASLTSDLARLRPSRWARRALRPRGLDFARAASPPPPVRVGPQRRLPPPPPPGREPRAAGAAPAARRASSAGQARRGAQRAALAAHPGEQPAPARPRQLWAISPRSAWCRPLLREPLLQPSLPAPKVTVTLTRRSVFFLNTCENCSWRLNNQGAVEDQGRALDSLRVSAYPGLVQVAPNPAISRDYRD